VELVGAEGQRPAVATHGAGDADAGGRHLAHVGFDGDVPGAALREGGGEVAGSAADVKNREAGEAGETGGAGGGGAVDVEKQGVEELGGVLGEGAVEQLRAGLFVADGAEEGPGAGERREAAGGGGHTCRLVGTRQILLLCWGEASRPQCGGAER